MRHYYRSSHQRCSMKKGVLRNFAKFTEKHLCQSLFFNKVAGLRFRYRCFPMNFAKFLRTPFLQNATGRLLLLLVQKKIRYGRVTLNEVLSYSLMLHKCFFWNRAIESYHFLNIFKLKACVRYVINSFMAQVPIIKVLNNGLVSI